MSKYTPGPWRMASGAADLYGDHCHGIDAGSGYLCPETNQGSLRPDICAADARLMAPAPDLALKRWTHIATERVECIRYGDFAKLTAVALAKAGL